MSDKIKIRHNKPWIKSITLLVLMTLIVTGCQAKGLVNYQEAVETTSNIEQGEVMAEIELNTVFNKAGLTIEEEKKLSPYENIITRITTKYDESDQNKLEMDIYYLVGAFGIDTSMFMTDDELIIQIPMINMYLKLDEDDKQGFKEADIKSEAVMQLFELNFERIIASWLDVFEEENVVVGKDTYVVTDEGKIKTTTYDFHLTEEQIKHMIILLLEEYDAEELNQILRMYTERSMENVTAAELESIDINEWLKMINITGIKGKAYVDFDNRLIKQEFILSGEGMDQSPGKIESFEIELSMTYNNLGDEQVFNFPELNEDNSVDLDGLNNIFDSYDF